MSSWRKSQGGAPNRGGGALASPIFFKVLGIGALVSVVFGGTTLYLTDSVTSRIHAQLLQQKTANAARALARDLLRPMITGDRIAVRQKLDQTLKSAEDVRYIVVRDSHNRTVAHTFEVGVPTALERYAQDRKAPAGEVIVFDSAEGRIFDVVVPIHEGRAGSVQLGSRDTMLNVQSMVMTRLILGALAVSAGVGISFAFLLAQYITHPIRHLEQVAQRIQEGDFEARSKVFAADEIGSLAGAFNHMAEALENYRREVQEKDVARTELIGKIVQAQEDERKNVARELHDQLGQSLSNTLLTLRGLSKDGASVAELTETLEKDLRGHIDETRRLAWDMRPALLDDFGLDSALKKYLDNVSRRLEIPIDYESVFPPGSGRLPPQVEITLYRIAQEAITNVIRHAQPTRISVVLIRQDGEVTLSVEDDGRGFDILSVETGTASTLGLMGMKERVALMAGEFEIESQLGSGTEVLVTLPIGETGENHHDDPSSHR